MNEVSGFLAYIAGRISALFQDFFDAALNLVSGSPMEGSLLNWLFKSWKPLLALLILGGIAANIIVYFARWKPHWWWFAKKRMVVDDALISKGKGKKVSAKKADRSRKAAISKPSTIVPRKDAAQSLRLSTIAPSPARRADADLTGDEELMELHTGKTRAL